MKIRVLVVDDEPGIVYTVKAILESNGFEVETADSAKEAVQKLRIGIFQAVLSDLRMETPQAGLDVIRSAKAQSYAPVAVLHTAYPIPVDEWKSWGADALFEKPANITGMAKKLQSLVKQRTLSSEG